MASYLSHPFGTSFESLSSSTVSVVESIHAPQIQQLRRLLGEPEGRLISLRAPRAGYGKTTLLTRLRDGADSDLLFVPVSLAEGRRLEGELILEEALNQLLEPETSDPRITRLDALTRKLFAQALLPMVKSGEVPSHDRAAAEESLRERPLEAFDFNSQGAAIAQWAKQQFRLLGPRLGSSLSKTSRTPGRQTSVWIKLLFEFASSSPSDLARTDLLMSAIFGGESALGSRANFREIAGGFLNLVTLVQPVVLVLDEVDGLSGDSDAALAVASHLASLWQSAPDSKCILSVNDDIWDSAFVPRLPHGLRDRLEDVVIRLEPLEEQQAKDLVVSRAGNSANGLCEQLHLDSTTLYPREVLKQARQLWSELDHTKKEVPSEETVYPPGKIAPVTVPKIGSPPRYLFRSPYPPKPVARIMTPVARVRVIYLTEILYPPAQVKRASIPVRGKLPNYQFSAPYPPSSLRPIALPKLGDIPQYLLKKPASYPPAVSPIKVPRHRALPVYHSSGLPAKKSAYPPKVNKLVPPVVKAPPKYLFESASKPEIASPFMTIPSPIDRRLVRPPPQLLVLLVMMKLRVMIEQRLQRLP